MPARYADPPTATVTATEHFTFAKVEEPRGYCNHGRNGMTCPVGVAGTPSAAH
jgi:hypothetical protein